MLTALIDNNSTWLIELEKERNINYQDELSILRNNYIGWLVNTENTLNYIDKLPIEQFYFVDRKEKKIFNITKEEAKYVYNSIKEVINKRK